MDSQRTALLIPYPTVLQHIPMPVLYGVFLHMGVTALNSIQVREGCTGRGCCWGGEVCSATAATAQQSLDFNSL